MPDSAYDWYAEMYGDEAMLGDGAGERKFFPPKAKPEAREKAALNASFDEVVRKFREAQRVDAGRDGCGGDPGQVPRCD